MTFKIWSPPHTMFAARILVEHLKLQGHEANFVHHVDPKDKTIYIIYCASRIYKLPKNYIVYQTEVPGSKWFDAKYLHTIKNAMCVWEYSEQNRKAYDHVTGKVCIVPPGVAIQPPHKKDIPVLFYGHLDKTTRRNKILEEIQKHIPVKIVTNVLQEKMWHLLMRSKVVINIHYYDKAPLEIFRINEALSFNCHVVSESSTSGDKQYSNYIEFSDNIAMFSRKAKHCGDIEFNKDITGLDSRNQIYKALQLLN